MAYFFIISLSILVFLNGYLFIKLSLYFGAGLWQLFVLLLLIGITAQYILQRHGVYNYLSDHFYFMLYAWIGFVAIAGVMFLSTDLLRLLAFIIKLLTNFNAGQYLRSSFLTPLILCLSIAISLFSIYTAHNPKLKFIVLEHASLKPDESVRIVAVSDMHLSQSIGPRYLRKVMNIVEEQDPDFLVFPGDLVDSYMKNRTTDAKIIKDTKVKQGKLAVFGNHESYQGLNNSIHFMQRSGLQILDNKVKEFDKVIFVGVNDPHVVSTSGISKINPVALMSKLKAKNKPIILLKHRPNTVQNEIGLFDLQLSGHTHSGQLWPLRALTEKTNNTTQGLSILKHKNQQSLRYVLNGTGYWGPPMRFIYEPDILVVDIIAPQTAE